MKLREEKGQEETRRPKRRMRKSEAKGAEEGDTLGNSGEDMIDPWSISTLTKLLKELDPWFTKYQGYISSAEPYFGEGAMSPINKIVEIGGMKYRIKKGVGKGGFSTVYKAFVTDSPNQVVALKIQTPAFPWEFHMLRQLDLRVPESQRSSFGVAHNMHVFQDCSILVCDYLPYGTLLDVINSYRTIGKPMEEVLCIYYTIEISSLTTFLFDMLVEISPKKAFLIVEVYGLVRVCVSWTGAGESISTFSQTVWCSTVIVVLLAFAACRCKRRSHGSTR